MFSYGNLNELAGRGARVTLPFLPPELPELATDELLYDAAYVVFQNDLIESKATFDQQSVKVNSTIGANGWEETFTHLITRDPKNGAPRTCDPARAKRVPWVKPTIENYKNPELTYFMFLEGSGYVRHYIWNKSNDYVVILESKNGAIYLVTGFVIDIPWKRYDLMKKLSKAI
jgi:hypothetical protein